jgi:hypothetical protein
MMENTVVNEKADPTPIGKCANRIEVDSRRDAYVVFTTGTYNPWTPCRLTSTFEDITWSPFFCLRSSGLIKSYRFIKKLAFDM